MEDLLTPVSRTYRKAEEEPELLTLSQPVAKSPKTDQANFRGASPEEALEALRTQPDYETVINILSYLQQGVKGRHPFNVLRPSPQGAQIAHVLVTDISPNYWTILKDESHGENKRSLELLLGCLRSVTGVNAVLAFLRALLQEAKKDPKGPKNSPVLINIRLTLDLLSAILCSDSHLQKVWDGTSYSETNEGKIRALRQEFVSQLASGKIVSAAAEAEILLREAEKLEDPFWMADSKSYTEWLSRSLVHWIESKKEDEDVKTCAELLTRALKLGHTDTLVKILYSSLLLHEGSQSVFEELLDKLPRLDQRKVVAIILKILSSQLPLDSDQSTEDYPLIWAAAGVLKLVVGSSQTRKDHLVAWLTEATGAGIGDSCGIRRAALAVIGGDKDTITTVLEKGLTQFGDQLYIKHSPLLQQEAHAQVLLLSAGYVHRLSPIKLNILLRSGPYLNAISNRIAAFQDRAKFLGMVVGEALSGLVHGAEKKLDFHMDEMNSEEAQWYKSLVQVSDQIGPISPLKVEETAYRKAPKTSKQPKPAPKPAARQPQAAPKSGFIIEEIEDDEEEEDEDDDLVPYDKPDSDAEDSDDDPTLINRDKPKAPVYIRDLITYLRDVDNYDRQKLALQTAPVLIRRKANYGTEVSSHAEELATLLVGLSDKYDLDKFHSLRLQGMVAVIVALPQRMGPWFAKTFFDGDYSLSQRSSILVVLGLAGRELAGYETSEYAVESAFPSKQLPAKLERHYASLPASSSSAYESSRSASSLRALPPNALDNISQSLSQKFLAPLAAEAADAATGPDALKLSTFTSRLEQQKQQSQEPHLVQQNSTLSSSKSKPRGVRTIPNTTANLLSTAFFFPLTGRFQLAVHATAGGSSNILFQPHLLSLYVRTLALLLHAAGPSTLALPRMTTEFWDLLLGVLRSSSSPLSSTTSTAPPSSSSSSSSLDAAAAELPVLHAVLFGLLALLDVHEAGAGDGLRGLCERHGREVVETTEWVGAVFDRVRGGDAGGGGEENQVKMMAAGVLIRLRDAVERYRGLLMGELIGAG